MGCAYRRHDDNVSSFQKGASGGVPHPVDVVIDLDNLAGQTQREGGGQTKHETHLGETTDSTWSMPSPARGEARPMCYLAVFDASWWRHHTPSDREARNIRKTGESLKKNAYRFTHFIDVGVRGRVEGLRQVVIVVAHEELDRVVGEKRAQLVRELRSQHLRIVEALGGE